MTPEHWRRIKELFHSALERAPAEREAFLDEACGEDAHARREVESLISAHEKDGEFLDVPAAAGMAAELVSRNLSELGAGRRVGAYRIVGTLGEGGMGKVYLAEDARLGRNVALKLLPASFMTDLERVGRFEQEARAASALNHPNILTIHEIGHDAGAHYIATEFVEGVTLRAHLKRGEMSVHEALEIAIQLAAALAAAHAARLVHRDIKPENIMVRPDGYIKVLDFGLAKPTGQTLSADGDSNSDSNSFSKALVNTRPGMVMGTVAYMSPEQARGLDVDARTDIWSLGVVLYEMLAGRPPFTGPTGSDVMVSVLNREPPPLAQLRPTVGSELERIVSKTLAKDREERYRTTKDLLIDLRRLKQRMEFEAEMSRAKETNEAAAQSPHASAHVAATSLASSSSYTSEQLKQVTVLFADFNGLAALAGTSDAEELGEMMRELWNRVDAVVMDHGGMVDRHMGDQLMALWGAQVAQEDDPEHAVRAALAMRAEVGDLAATIRRGVDGKDAHDVGDDGPPMSIGINTGAVLLGTVG
ncbi:MAG: protein kinase, partial [Pyrinomonadaceae bacterium]